MVNEGKPEKKVSKTSQAEGEVVKEEKPKAIMVKPLPQILDEIEESIRLANEAAMDARKAAEEARRAGEKAAGEAARVAAEAIGKVEQVAKNAMQLAELLKSTIMEATALIDSRLSGKK